MKAILGRLLLMLGGLVIGLSCALLAITLFPNLVPKNLRDPLGRQTRNTTLEVTYTLLDGDLFYHQAGNVKPPAENEVLSRHTIYWDKDGFRTPAITAEEYPIIVLGDSFTEAWMVATPWTDVLASELAKPVRNLAYRGYGPLEYRSIMEEYGQDQHEWVILGFFEGNDLQNIATSTIRNEDGQAILDNILRQATRPEDTKIVESPDGNYKYPLALYIGADFYEQAFYEFYLWVLNAEPETYANSRNITVYQEVLENIAALSGDACLAVVYLPSKEQIYFPYAEPFGRRWILDNGTETYLDADGWLTGDETPNIIDFDLLVSRLGNMRMAVKTATEAAGWQFIDLSPAFIEAAANSQMLYLTYDTHWNQAGHDLAGRVVAEQLRGLTCE